MGSKNYDNWERLVEAVLRREELRELALCPSISSLSSSVDHSFRESFESLQLSADSRERSYLTPDDQEIISKTLYPGYFHGDRNGKKCFMVGAEDLIISWGDAPEYWKWIPHADSRFARVAKLEQVWWLDIRGKIKTRMLSPQTTYTAFLVFKLAYTYRGLEEAKATVKFVGDESDEDAEKRAHIVHLQNTYNIKGIIASSRMDGWMEVEMGDFYIEEGGNGNGEVEARLLETRSYKGGLIVQGIEFRPSRDSSSFITKEEQMRGRNRKERRGFSFFR